MLNAILGIKKEMNQTFIQGRRIPVTIVSAGPCLVTQVKTPEKDGYWAIQIGYGKKKIKNISKPLRGHLKKVTKAKNAPSSLVEVRFDAEPTDHQGKVFKVGDLIKVSDLFEVGDYLSVSAISKGKGFAGVVKRWHFAGGPRTHGQSDRPRSPGSIGAGTDPGRVFKGKKMAGRMGGEKVTLKNLQLISINSESGEIQISGPIPGVKGNLVLITRLRKGQLEGMSEVKAKVVEGEEEVEEENKQEGEVKTEEKIKEEKQDV